MYKILVADDEPAMNTLVCDFLAKEGYETISAEDGEDALEKFRENPDISLVILDIMMPKIDGWEVCRTIRETSNVPVLMLSARSQEFDELTGFEAGADDYVTKPCSPAVLVKRVGVLLRRQGAREAEHVFKLDGLKFDTIAHEVIVDGKSITLTLKEYSILYKLISAKGVVFSREQLLDDIWGFDFDGDMRTVDSHVARLRTKLGKWGAEHIKTIYGTGYKVDSE